jgi:hypothetical protein
MDNEKILRVKNSRKAYLSLLRYVFFCLSSIYTKEKLDADDFFIQKR